MSPSTWRWRNLRWGFDCLISFHLFKLCLALQSTKVIDAWLCIDSRPFKQALLTTVKKWSFMFKQYLTDHVNHRCSIHCPVHTICFRRANRRTVMSFVWVAHACFESFISICVLLRIFIELFFFVFSLKDLSEFIEKTTGGLSVEVEEGNYDGLVDVMYHLMAVKDRQASTDVMFEPLKETVELLSSYTQETPEDVLQQLEVGIRYMCES